MRDAISLTSFTSALSGTQMAHINDNGEVTSSGNYKGWHRREQTEKDANNAARFEFLRSLSAALGDTEIDAQEGAHKSFSVSADFMDKLSKKLGKEFKIKDFGAPDGHGRFLINTGRPLTARRIQAITAAQSREIAERDAKNDLNNTEIWVYDHSDHWDDDETITLVPTFESLKGVDLKYVEPLKNFISGVLADNLEKLNEKRSLQGSDGVADAGSALDEFCKEVVKHMRECAKKDIEPNFVAVMNDVLANVK